MDLSEEEYRPTNRRRRKESWLPVLEQALKQRMGWTDEAVSPFARQSRTHSPEADIRRAA
jgi:hypothetical protein